MNMSTGNNGGNRMSLTPFSAGLSDLTMQPASAAAPTQPMTGASPQPPTPQLFGVVAPGSPVKTDFVQADPTGLKFTLSLADLPVPVASIPDLVFFFLPGAVETLPPQHGALLYWQATMTAVNGPQSETTGFELLGSIEPNRTSGIFRTGWGTNEALASSIGNPNVQVVITLGVSVEPLSNIQNLQIAGRGVEDRLNVAKKIANDLFNFLQSFDDTSRSGYMTVPTNVFERWMTRFENKFRVDPNFFMKSA